MSSLGGLLVSESLFGGNFLFNRDRLNGTFPDKSSELGLTGYRYPGGSITESLFDIRNPDKTSTVNPRGEIETLVPLSEFMDYAAEAQRPVTIVIPTRTVLTEGSLGNRDVDLAEIQAIKSFVVDVLGGKYGTASIYAFEVGNEYWGSGEMSSIEYGRVASAMSAAIQEGINEHKRRLPDSNKFEEPLIAVQIGQRGAFDQTAGSNDLNQLVMREFNEVEAAAVDAVLIHYYTTGRPDELLLSSNRFTRLDAWESDPRFQDIQTFATEWNIAAPESEQRGLAQAGALLAMLSEMVVRGIDAAWIWPIQQNTTNDLSGNEGRQGLTIAGEAFSMMSESLIGSMFISRAVNEHFGTYFFSDAESLIVFHASHLATAATHRLDMRSWLNGSGSATMTVLSTKGPVLDANATPVVTSQVISIPSSGVLELNLNPFEFVRVEVSLGATWSRSVQGREIIEGTNSADRVDGLEGNDIIDGGGGVDTIFGGAGDDFLFGGGGRDILYGGTGNDIIVGGGGGDSLFGGLGADVFRLPDISDSGTLPATSDVIADFEQGRDTIDLSLIDALAGSVQRDEFVFRGREQFRNFEGGEVFYRSFDRPGTADDFTMVYIDTDADIAPESVLRINGLFELTATDFIL